MGGAASRRGQAGPGPMGGYGGPGYGGPGYAGPGYGGPGYGGGMHSQIGNLPLIPVNTTQTPMGMGMGMPGMGMNMGMGMPMSTPMPLPYQVPQPYPIPQPVAVPQPYPVAQPYPVPVEFNPSCYWQPPTAQLSQTCLPPAQFVESCSYIQPSPPQPMAYSSCSSAPKTISTEYRPKPSVKVYNYPAVPR